MNTGIVALFQSKTLTLNFYRSLDYARGDDSILYFTDLCKPIETYIYDKKKHPFTISPAAKHPDAANLLLQKFDKNQWTSLITRTGVDLAPAISLQI